MLKVKRKASKQELKKAKNKRMLEVHPDKARGDLRAAEASDIVNDAFELLSQPEARQSYNQQLEAMEAQQAAQRTQRRENTADTVQGGVSVTINVAGRMWRCVRRLAVVCRSHPASQGGSVYHPLYL